jgi:hypothetical protein
MLMIAVGSTALTVALGPETRGSETAAHRALRDLGYLGWSELLGLPAGSPAGSPRAAPAAVAH